MSDCFRGRSNRRQFLLTCGVAVGSVGLAGCTGSEDESADSGESSTATQSDTVTETEPSVRITDSEVFLASLTSDGTGDDVPWQRIEIQNPTDELHRDVDIQSRFRNSDEEILATREQSTAAIPPQTTWIRYSRHDFEMSNLSDTENLITDQEVGTRGSLVDNYELLNASMDFDEGFGVVSVTGELELSDDSISDLVVVPLVYDSEDRFRGAFRIRVQNVNPTAAFDGGLIGFRAPSNQPKPENFELLVAEPYF